ncbi:MAG: hdfR 3 [Caproiciproducens sp.]|nr:hdfR 3 [Caproiciproducens sp.]
MDFRQLKYFITVAETLSFTVASKQLYVTPPALSQQISDLEKQLDEQLFIRAKHSIKLTTVGEVMLKEARAVIARVEEARQVVKQAAAGSVGSLSIVIAGTFHTKFLPKLLRQFNADYPNINVDIRKFDWTKLSSLLEQKQPDILFTLINGLQKYPTFNYKTLYSDKLVLVVPRDHPLAHETSISLNRVAALPLLGANFEKHFDDFCLISKLCHTHGYTPNLVGYYPNYDSLLFAVESGKGVTLSGRSGVETSSYKNLRCIDIEGPESYLDLVVAWQRNTTNPVAPLFLRKLGVVI